jgi:hypothetical protein
MNGSTATYGALGDVNPVVTPRRLRLHGLIERLPGTHRYRVTRPGSRTLLFCTRTYNRLLRPGLAQIMPEEVLDDSELRRGFDEFDRVLDDWIEEKRVSA